MAALDDAAAGGGDRREMMGVPADRAADFKRWSNAILGLPGEPHRLRTASPRLMELRSLFGSGTSLERRACQLATIWSALSPG